MDTMGDETGSHIGTAEGSSGGTAVCGMGSGQPLVGLDLVGVPRFRAVLRRHPRLLERVFTPAELDYCLARVDPAQHLAGRFAAKEAVGKLLRRGVVSWREIEIAAGPAPEVRLMGATSARASDLGVGVVGISLSHTESVAGACAFAMSSRPASEVGSDA